MRKILIVFNGVGYPNHVMEFAMKLAANGASLLHAVFMKPMHVDESLQYPFPNDLSMTEGLTDEEDERRTDVQAIEDNKQVFRDECQVHNINYKIDGESEILLDGLVEHSKFSDLIIADVNDDLGNYSVKDFLGKTQCPVILVQRQTEFPERVILAYDGTASSIYALKMYSYLFPEWRNLNSLLVQVNPKDREEINQQQYLSDWLSQHFEKLEIRTLTGDVENELTALISSHSQKTMMVMGSYGKKGLAGLFHQPLADKMMEVSHVSLFIAHL
jgi:nucleotide-binding universal stress UspA family protein